LLNIERQECCEILIESGALLIPKYENVALNKWIYFPVISQEIGDNNDDALFSPSLTNNLPRKFGTSMMMHFYLRMERNVGHGSSQKG